MLICMLTSIDDIAGKFVCKGMSLVSCFVLEDNIVNAIQETPLKCCNHGNLEISHMTPDLVSSPYYLGSKVIYNEGHVEG